MSQTIFGKNLKYLRKRDDLSQNQMAKQLLSSRSVVYKIENGKLSPNLCLVERTCKLYNMDILTITTQEIEAA